jgi:hypothetical protein
MVPVAVLEKEGHTLTVDRKADPTSDTVVFSKHWTSNDISYAQFCRLRGQKVVFDICDNHFNGKFDEFYRKMAANADVITVNSKEMQKAVRKETKKEAILIEDPVISQPMPFKEGYPVSMIWYGNPQNLPGVIETYSEDCEVPLELIVGGQVQLPDRFNKPWITFSQWNPNCITEAAQENSIAFLPYRQHAEYKSPNRIIEAIQSGLFVIADIIPAAKKIPGIWDLKKGLKEGIAHYTSGKAKQDVLAGQEYIKRYYPQEIAKQWEAVL